MDLYGEGGKLYYYNSDSKMAGWQTVEGKNIISPLIMEMRR